MNISSLVKDDVKYENDGGRCLGMSISNLVAERSSDDESDEDANVEENEIKSLPFCNKTDNLQDSGLVFDSTLGDSCSMMEGDCSLNSHLTTSHSLTQISRTSNDSSYFKLLASRKPCVTPKKENVSNTNGATEQSPLTPTANLKVLLHAASPEIRNYERRKLMYPSDSLLDDPNQQECDNYRKSIKEHEEPDLFRSLLDNQNILNRKHKCDNELSSSPKVDALSRSENILQKDKLSANEKLCNRKEKSLGLLCRRFLQLYPETPREDISISLDEAALKLSVGRRRIYDIINVLESIKIVVRLAKNNYSWRGRNGLTKTLREIKDTAEQNGFAAKLTNMLSQYENFKPISSKPNGEEISSLEQNDSDSSELLSMRRRDKSLGILSKKFVTLFIVQPGQPVSFEMAARVLITQGNPTENKYKTKVRRLYDIANILTSLKLIKKVNVPGRKPSFRWIGPEISSSSSPKSNSSFSSPHRNLWTSPSLKLVSFDDGFSSLCEVVEQERKELCITTPDKSSSCAFATPVKDGKYSVLTPIKGLASRSLSSARIDLDGNGNVNLDSSFNRDEVFRKELESLRERFPSPMSRLLSACNVQQAFSQHKKKKKGEEEGMKNHARRNLESTSKVPASIPSSPVKPDLAAYLNEQQEIISSRVDYAVEGMNDESRLAVDVSNNRSLNEHLKPSSSCSTRTTLPVSLEKLLPLSKANDVTSGAEFFRVSTNCAKKEALTLSMKHAMRRDSNPRSLQAIKLAPLDVNSKKQAIHVKLPETTIQPQKKGAMKVVINPSNTVSTSRFSALTNQEGVSDTNQKSVRVYRVNLSGQSSLAQVAPSSNKHNFVKLDLHNLRAPQVGNQQSSLFKRVSKSKCITRRNSSVVTNLATRLGEQGPRSNDDLLLTKRIVFDDLPNKGQVTILKPVAKKRKVEKVPECQFKCLPTSESDTEWISGHRADFNPIGCGGLQTSTPRVKYRENTFSLNGEVGSGRQSNVPPFASYSLSSTPASCQSSSRPASSCDFMSELDAGLSSADR